MGTPASSHPQYRSGGAAFSSRPRAAGVFHRYLLRRTQVGVNIDRDQVRLIAPRFFTDDIVDGMKISVGPFTASQLLDLINNEHVRAPIRRFAPQHNADYVDKKGVVVLVVRDKKELAPEKLVAVQNERCPGTAYFVVDSGVLSSAAAFVGADHVVRRGPVDATGKHLT
jgi:hypothetical protein